MLAMEPLRSREACQHWLQIVALHLLGMVLLMPLLAGWQKLTGIAGPDAFDKFPREWLLPVVVLAAPVIEEMLFRGWLSGRPRALWLVLCALAAGIPLAMTGGNSPLAAIALIAALIAAPLGWFALRKRPAPDWFQRGFGVIFFGAALLFGAAHLVNFSQASLLALPLVAPQLWAGMTLGYLRTRHGLWAGILAHATSNGLALLVATGLQ